MAAPVPCRTKGRILHDTKIYAKGVGLIRAGEAPKVSVLRWTQLITPYYKELELLTIHRSRDKCQR
jgi:hypothetical protein